MSLSGSIACVASVSVGLGSKEEKERPKDWIFGVLPALRRLDSGPSPLGHPFFNEALTMFMSVAVYYHRSVFFFPHMSLQFSDIRRIQGPQADVKERGMELFEPADSPKCARTAREEENPRWRVEQQIANSREIY